MRLNVKDQENLVKACQTGDLLVQDLRALVSADNPLLSDIAEGLQQQAIKLEQHLQRLEVITRPTNGSGD